MMPALATKTSIGPSFCSISAIATSSESGSVTSAETVSVPFGPSPDRAVTATLKPAACNSCAMAYPIPRLPPVTRATLCMSSLSGNTSES